MSFRYDIISDETYPVDAWVEVSWSGEIRIRYEGDNDRALYWSVNETEQLVNALVAAIRYATGEEEESK